MITYGHENYIAEAIEGVLMQECTFDIELIIAKELFPENSGANRGGDLHAWLKLMCYHKQMAWSRHLGAIYHRDSVKYGDEKCSCKYSIIH
jgi:hypothetical protein